MAVVDGWVLEVGGGLAAPNRLEGAAGAVVVGAAVLAVDVEEGAAGLNRLGVELGAAAPVVGAAEVD